MASMTMARTGNYWISSTAIYITLNAMGEPDYLQGSVSSGAQVLCYMKDIDGLGYDAGHNYRRWQLTISPTYFNTTTEKYVYVAIPRSDVETDIAQVVFPSEKLDIYGKNESGTQMGNTDYYYIWLQGIISASEVNGAVQRREWTQRIDTGSLASDEALDAGGENTWWRYSSVSDTVEFLKTISNAVFENLLATIATITTLFLGANKDKLTGVAVYPSDSPDADNTNATADDDNQTVVTPKYLGERGAKDWISKKHDDYTDGHVTFNNGSTVKNGLESDNIRNSGNITNEGDIKTKNLYVTGSAHFFEVSIDKIKASGGAHIYSAADGFTIDIVENITDKNRVRLYWLAEKDGKSIMNMWKELDQAICMNFNQATTGTSHNISNKYYWALVTDVSGSTTVEKTVNDVTNLYNWIELSTEIVDGTLNPEVGDEIAMLGYRGTDDVARQSAIYDSAYSSLDTDLTPPFRAYYRGINDFSLKSHRYTYTDAYSFVLKGVTIQQLEDTNLRLEVDSTLGFVLDFGEVTTLTCTIVDALWNDHTSEATSWYIERDTGDSVNDAAWQQKAKVVAFNSLSEVDAAIIDIAFAKSDCDIAKDTLLSTIFTITAYKKDSDGAAQVMAKRSFAF